MRILKRFHILAAALLAFLLLSSIPFLTVHADDNAKITFISNGTTVKTETVAIGDTAVKPADPTESGYIFKYWYAEDPNTAYLFDTPVGKDFTLNAAYTPVTWTVHYNANGGGSTMADSTFSYDTPGTLPDITNTLTRYGYNFDSWNTKADGQGTAYKDEDIVSNWTAEAGRTFTLYAIWEEDTKITDSKTVTFDPNADEMSHWTVSVKADTPVNEPAEIFRSGYQLSSWSTDKSGTPTWDFSKNSVTDDKTLYAQWVKKQDVTITVNFTSADPADQSVLSKYSKTVTVPYRSSGTVDLGTETAALSKLHYIADPSKLPAAYQNITAKQVIEISVTHETASSSTQQDAPIVRSILHEPTGDPMEYMKEEQNLTYTVVTTVTTDLVTGKDISSRQTIVWKNGSVFPAKKPIESLTKYGWDPSPASIPKKDLGSLSLAELQSFKEEDTFTYTAKDPHTITFDPSPGTRSYTSQTVPDGGSIVTGDAPILDGYKFAGWYFQDGTKLNSENRSNVKSDLTLYARYNPLVTVTFTFKDIDPAAPQDLSAYTSTMEVVQSEAAEVHLSKQTDALKALNYQVDPKDVPATVDGTVLNIEIPVSHQTSSTAAVSDVMTVNRTIKYTLPGANDTIIVQKGTYKTSVKTTTDLITKGITTDTSYLTVSGLNAFTPPAVSGYTPSISAVPAVTSYTADTVKDSLISITYSKNTEAKEPAVGRTCQDDGYPAGYYWDEEKQACLAPAGASSGQGTGTASGTGNKVPASQTTAAPTATPAASSSTTPTAAPTPTPAVTHDDIMGGKQSSSHVAAADIGLFLIAFLSGLAGLLHRSRSLAASILSGAAMAGSALLLIFTQHFGSPLNIADSYTIWFGAIAAAGVIAALLSYYAGGKDDDQDGSGQQ